MAAFGASPLGRLALRRLLSRAPEYQSAQAIVRAFKGIFVVGGMLVTSGVAVGVVLAWNDGLLTQRWILASIGLITVAGLANVTIEDRWLNSLSRADHEAFVAILHERVPYWAALVSPIAWLFILWLMIEKPV